MRTQNYIKQQNGSKHNKNAASTTNNIKNTTKQIKQNKIINVRNMQNTQK